MTGDGPLILIVDDEPPIRRLLRTSLAAQRYRVTEAAGGELITVETDLSADGLINNVSELISRGVDGILLMPASDSMLPTVDAMCAEAGVYWGTMFRTISDSEIRDQIYASQWFAGGCNEDDEACAANIVKAMANMGVKNLCCINIARHSFSIS